MFDDPDRASPDHSTLLGILARADGARLAAFAETLLPALGDVAVIQSRTGLVMLPMRDTVQGTDFHLGEVLVAEAHIRAGDGTEGYGMVVGRDLTRAMAMAVVDASAARAATCPSESVLPIRLRPDFSVVFEGYAGGAEHWPCRREAPKRSLGADILRTCCLRGFSEFYPSD